MSNDRRLVLDIFDMYDGKESDGHKLCNLYDSSARISGLAVNVIVTTLRNGYQLISFELPAKIHTLNGLQDNYRLDYLIGDYYIRLIDGLIEGDYKDSDDILWFIISLPKITHSAFDMNVSVTAASSSYLLKNKCLDLLFSDTLGNNTGTAYELLDAILELTDWVSYKKAGHTPYYFIEDLSTTKATKITSTDVDTNRTVISNYYSDNDWGDWKESDLYEWLLYIAINGKTNFKNYFIANYQDGNVLLTDFDRRVGDKDDYGSYYIGNYTYGKLFDQQNKSPQSGYSFIISYANIVLDLNGNYDYYKNIYGKKATQLLYYYNLIDAANGSLRKIKLYDSIGYVYKGKFVSPLKSLMHIVKLKNSEYTTLTAEALLNKQNNWANIVHLMGAAWFNLLDVLIIQNVLKTRSLKASTKTGAFKLISSMCELFDAKPIYHTNLKMVLLLPLNPFSDDQLDKGLMPDVTQADGVLLIHYGKNLKSVTRTLNTLNMITKLYAYGSYGDTTYGYCGISKIIVPIFYITPKSDTPLLSGQTYIFQILNLDKVTYSYYSFVPQRLYTSSDTLKFLCQDAASKLFIWDGSVATRVMELDAAPATIDLSFSNGCVLRIVDELNVLNKVIFSFIMNFDYYNKYNLITDLMIQQLGNYYFNVKLNTSKATLYSSQMSSDSLILGSAVGGLSSSQPMGRLNVKKILKSLSKIKLILDTTKNFIYRTDYDITNDTQKFKVYAVLCFDTDGNPTQVAKYDSVSGLPTFDSLGKQQYVNVSLSTAASVVYIIRKDDDYKGKKILYRKAYVTRNDNYYSTKLTLLTINLSYESLMSALGLSNKNIDDYVFLLFSKNNVNGSLGVLLVADLSCDQVLKLLLQTTLLTVTDNDVEGLPVTKNHLFVYSDQAPGDITTAQNETIDGKFGFYWQKKAPHDAGLIWKTYTSIPEFSFYTCWALNEDTTWRKILYQLDLPSKSKKDCYWYDMAGKLYHYVLTATDDLLVGWNYYEVTDGTVDRENYISKIPTVFTLFNAKDQYFFGRPHSYRYDVPKAGLKKNKYYIIDMYGKYRTFTTDRDLLEGDYLLLNFDDDLVHEYEPDEDSDLDDATTIPDTTISFNTKNILAVTYHKKNVALNISWLSGSIALEDELKVYSFSGCKSSDYETGINVLLYYTCLADGTYTKKISKELDGNTDLINFTNGDYTSTRYTLFPALDTTSTTITLYDYLQTFYMGSAFGDDNCLTETLMKTAAEGGLGLGDYSYIITLTPAEVAQKNNKYSITINKSKNSNNVKDLKTYCRLQAIKILTYGKNTSNVVSKKLILNVDKNGKPKKDDEGNVILDSKGNVTYDYVGKSMIVHITRISNEATSLQITTCESNHTSVLADVKTRLIILTHVKPGLSSSGGSNIKKKMDAVATILKFGIQNDKYFPVKYYDDQILELQEKIEECTSAMNQTQLSSNEKLKYQNSINSYNTQINAIKGNSVWTAYETLQTLSFATYVTSSTDAANNNDEDDSKNPYKNHLALYNSKFTQFVGLQLLNDFIKKYGTYYNSTDKEQLSLNMQLLYFSSGSYHWSYTQVLTGDECTNEGMTRSTIMPVVPNTTYYINPKYEDGVLTGVNSNKNKYQLYRVYFYDLNKLFVKSIKIKNTVKNHSDVYTFTVGSMYYYVRFTVKEKYTKDKFSSWVPVVVAKNRLSLIILDSTDIYSLLQMSTKYKTTYIRKKVYDELAKVAEDKLKVQNGLLELSEATQKTLLLIYSIPTYINTLYDFSNLVYITDYNKLTAAQKAITDGDAALSSAFHDMYRLGYWQKSDYVSGDLQMLYNDAIKNLKKVSKPLTSYSIEYIDVYGSQLNMNYGVDLVSASVPWQDISINSAVHLIDPDLDINEWGYVDKIAKCYDNPLKTSLSVNMNLSTISQHSFTDVMTHIALVANQVNADVQTSAVAYGLASGTVIDGSMIGYQSLSGFSISPGTINGVHLSNGCVTADKILANSITANEIAAHTITADNIQAGSITTLSLSANCIDASKISAGAITADSIRAGSITTDKLQAGAVTADTISANAITTDKLAANAITADKIAANSITADKIAAGTITADLLAADAVTTNTIFSSYSYSETLGARTAFIDTLIADYISVPKLRVTDDMYATLIWAGCLKVRGTDGLFHNVVVNVDKDGLSQNNLLVGSSGWTLQNLRLSGFDLINGTVMADSLDVNDVFANNATIKSLIAAQLVANNSFLLNVAMHTVATDSFSLTVANGFQWSSGQNLLLNTKLLYQYVQVSGNSKVYVLALLKTLYVDYDTLKVDKDRTRYIDLIGIYNYSNGSLASISKLKHYVTIGSGSTEEYTSDYTDTNELTNINKLMNDAGAYASDSDYMTISTLRDINEYQLYHKDENNNITYHSVFFHPDDIKSGTNDDSTDTRKKLFGNRNVLFLGSYESKRKIVPELMVTLSANVNAIEGVWRLALRFEKNPPDASLVAYSNSALFITVDHLGASKDTVASAVGVTPILDAALLGVSDTALVVFSEDVYREYKDKYDNTVTLQTLYGFASPDNLSDDPNTNIPYRNLTVVALMPYYTYKIYAYLVCEGDYNPNEITFDELSGQDCSGTCMYSSVMLEYGLVPTKWKASNFDTDNAVSSIKVTSSGLLLKALNLNKDGSYGYSSGVYITPLLINLTSIQYAGDLDDPLAHNSYLQLSPDYIKMKSATIDIKGSGTTGGINIHTDGSTYNSILMNNNGLKLQSANLELSGTGNLTLNGQNDLLIAGSNIRIGDYTKMLNSSNLWVWNTDALTQAIQLGSSGLNIHSGTIDIRTSSTQYVTMNATGINLSSNGTINLASGASMNFKTDAAINMDGGSIVLGAVDSNSNLSNGIKIITNYDNSSGSKVLTGGSITLKTDASSMTMNQSSMSLSSGNSSLSMNTSLINLQNSTSNYVKIGKDSNNKSGVWLHASDNNYVDITQDGISIKQNGTTVSLNSTNLTIPNTDDTDTDANEDGTIPITHYINQRALTAYTNAINYVNNQINNVNDTIEDLEDDLTNEQDGSLTLLNNKLNSLANIKTNADGSIQSAVLTAIINVGTNGFVVDANGNLDIGSNKDVTIASGGLIKIGTIDKDNDNALTNGLLMNDEYFYMTAGKKFIITANSSLNLSGGIYLGVPSTNAQGVVTGSAICIDDDGITLGSLSGKNNTGKITMYGSLMNLFVAQSGDNANPVFRLGLFEDGTLKNGIYIDKNYFYMGANNQMIVKGGSSDNGGIYLAVPSENKDGNIEGALVSLTNSGITIGSSTAGSNLTLTSCSNITMTGGDISITAAKNSLNVVTSGNISLLGGGSLTMTGGSIDMTGGLIKLQTSKKVYLDMDSSKFLISNNESQITLTSTNINLDVSSGTISIGTYGKNSVIDMYNKLQDDGYLMYINAPVNIKNKAAISKSLSVKGNISCANLSCGNLSIDGLEDGYENIAFGDKDYYICVGKDAPDNPPSGTLFFKISSLYTYDYYLKQTLTGLTKQAQSFTLPNKKTTGVDLSAGLYVNIYMLLQKKGLISSDTTVSIKLLDGTTALTDYLDVKTISSLQLDGTIKINTKIKLTTSFNTSDVDSLALSIKLSDDQKYKDTTIKYTCTISGKYHDPSTGSETSYSHSGTDSSKSTAYDIALKYFLADTTAYNNYTTKNVSYSNSNTTTLSYSIVLKSGKTMHVRGSSSQYQTITLTRYYN